MCRNIRMLFHFEPPATEDEIRAAALQFVRKVSGTRKPARANEPPFDRAVEAVAQATRELLEGLEPSGAPHDRAHEKAKAMARNVKRFGRAP